MAEEVGRVAAGSRFLPFDDLSMYGWLEMRWDTLELGESLPER